MSNCVACGRDLDDFLEGIWTYEDGQRAHLRCHEYPHVIPARRRAENAAPFDPTYNASPAPSAPTERP